MADEGIPQALLESSDSQNPNPVKCGGESGTDEAFTVPHRQQLPGGQHQWTHKEGQEEGLGLGATAIFKLDHLFQYLVVA